MVCVRSYATVMPKQAEVAVVETHFVDEAFAEEIRLVFGEMHVVFVTQRAVHDGERMKREVSQLHGDWIDPTDSAACLQTEAGGVGKTHREIIGIAGICQALHLFDGTAQVVRTIHPAVLDFRNGAVVTAVNTQIDVIMTQHVFQMLEIPSP